jgi:hypothetical protein
MPALLFLRRWWKPIAGVVAVLVLLLVYRAQMAKAYDRGMNDCTVAHAAAAAAQAQADQRRTDAADAAAAAEIASLGRVETVYVDRVRKIYRDRPARACIDADGVRLIREADAALAGKPAAIGLDTVRAADSGKQP